jgi:hypothetical protein
VIPAKLWKTYGVQAQVGDDRLIHGTNCLASHYAPADDTARARVLPPHLPRTGAREPQRLEHQMREGVTDRHTRYHLDHTACHPPARVVVREHLPRPRQLMRGSQRPLDEMLQRVRGTSVLIATTGPSSAILMRTAWDVPTCNPDFPGAIVSTHTRTHTQARRHATRRAIGPANHAVE